MLHWKFKKFKTCWQKLLSFLLTSNVLIIASCDPTTNAQKMTTPYSLLVHVTEFVNWTISTISSRLQWNLESAINNECKCVQYGCHVAWFTICSVLSFDIQWCWWLSVVVFIIHYDNSSFQSVEPGNSMWKDVGSNPGLVAYTVSSLSEWETWNLFSNNFMILIFVINWKVVIWHGPDLNHKP